MDRKVEVIENEPALAKRIEIRELPLLEALDFIEREGQIEPRRKLMLAILEASTTFDGQPITYEQLTQLGASKLRPLARIGNRAQVLNGITDETPAATADGAPGSEAKKA
jgi:hypothetical protein